MAVSCSRQPDHAPVQRKVVFIGFDAATWDVMDSLIENGKLPHFAKLISNGARAPLKTLKPTLSPTVWTTIVTGMLPAKHGITGFSDDQGTLLTSVHRKAKSVWEICSEKNIPSTVINFWNTWPVEPVSNSVIVSDRFTFRGIPHAVFPEDILAEINFRKVYPLGYLDGFLSVPFETQGYPTLDIQLTTYVHLLREAIAYDEMCRNASFHLYESFQTGLFAVYYRYLDIVQHTFWQFMQPHESDPQPELIQDLKNVIPAYYQYYDRILGDYVARTGPDTIFVIVSDHGASSAALEREYVKEHNVPLKPVRAPETQAARRFRPDVNRILNWMGYVEYSAGNNISPRKTILFDACDFNVDWNTRVLAFNLKTNYRESSLDVDRANELLPKITSQLEKLETSSTAIPVFTEVKPVEFGIYCRFNDILSPEDTIMVNGKTHAISECSTYTEVSGAHTLGPDGILIISGPPHIIERVSLPAAGVEDVTPTILYLMGIPVSREMDGKVLKKIFNKDFLKRFPVAQIDSYGQRVVADDIQSSPDIDKKIENQLKSLGYIN